MQRVLVIEENEDLRNTVLLALHKAGVLGEAVGNVAEAPHALEKGNFDVVVLGPTGGELPELLDQLGDGVRAAAAILAVVEATVDAWDDGLRALRQGANDFIPSVEVEKALLPALRKLDARRQFEINQGTRASRGLSESGTSSSPGPAHVSGGPTTLRSMAGGGKQVGPRRAVPVFVGASSKMVAVQAMIRRIAAVRASVLVGGESGTGKELVAEALHDQSPWRDGPFVAVNCGAIPAGLIESELFGHVRGAFTDAVRDKQGLFQAADGGTLFLDEIADLPLALQPKLLRALQEGVVRRVGDVADVRVDVRIVAATARNLRNEVAAQQFREDLYYRLAALTIQIPALRERPDDVPPLAEHFLARARARLGIQVSEIDAAAMRLLTSYPWPGNVRELENTIERAAVLCSNGRIDVASLPERMQPAAEEATPAVTTSADEKPALLDPAELSIKQASRRIEEELIRRALRVTTGNRTRAAELLEISHRALLYKIKEYGISVASGRDPGIKDAGIQGAKEGARARRPDGI